ncbi:hypothetical protein GLAREA_06981 [Glarea lozoyensis ATCC 20868]|uniref:Uncharacterized protein n=1 Tax=Glarea lozoyensis (strain ATCC 20868 / MF5171) TaxID=1116229 RepID=S3E6G5_GLAL2|nr:uncharacterized protein GLAREA_06981 [Glarea lozoyensis ATCC 20868]EPE33968.1 hypothetical protein GLAREA_06981 [Glarea lozoyensis ATCC 20868]
MPPTVTTKEEIAKLKSDLKTFTELFDVLSKTCLANEEDAVDICEAFNGVRERLGEKIRKLEEEIAEGKGKGKR